MSTIDLETMDKYISYQLHVCMHILTFGKLYLAHVSYRNVFSASGDLLKDGGLRGFGEPVATGIGGGLGGFCEDECSWEFS